MGTCLKAKIAWKYVVYLSYCPAKVTFAK